MRKNLFALESEEVEPIGEGTELTPEAAELAEAESVQDANQLEASMQGAARMLEVADGLESMAIVAGEVKEATPTELALIQNSTQLAVAGTDVEPERLLPSLESWKGGAVAVEDLRENAKRIWDNIQAILKRLWEETIRYFQVSYVIPSHERTIAELEKLIRRKKNQVKANPQEIKVNYSALVFNGGVVKNAADLKQGLEYTLDMARYVFGTNPEQVADLGGDLAKAIKNFDVANSGETVTEVRNIMASYKVTKPPMLTVTQPAGDFVVEQSKPLMGGGDVRLKTFQRNEHATPLGALDHFRKTGVSFNNDAPVRGTDTTFELMTLAQMEDLLRIARDLLRQVKDFNGGARLGRLKRAGDELKAASEKASKAFLAAGGEAKVSHAVVNDYRSLLNFNHAYMHWVQQPAIPFYGKCLRTSKALTILVALCVQQYEDE